MENKKILLVLDWSNLLFRSLFMNSLYSHAGSYDRIEDIRSFMYKFTTDVCSIINIFKPTNVIIATDSQHAWRKDVLPGDELTPGYKSNRKKAENVNWDNIFKCADDLQEILSRNSLHVAKVQHCEADDIAAMCKELVFEKYTDYNIIIVSADGDIRQLIDFNPVTKQYCLVYNTTSKGRGKSAKRFMYVTEEFYDWFNLQDNNSFDIFFENVDLSKQYIKDILNANPVMDLCVENPNNVVLNKIFCGDDGDCVPSFYSWYKDGKKVRITPSKEKKVREIIGINTVADLVKGKNLLKPVLEKVCKKEIDDIDVNERLDMQRVLVELNSSLFPDYIREYKDVLSNMLEDIPVNGFWNIKAPQLLAGTEYEGYDKKKVIEAEVFKDMEKYINPGTNTVSPNALFT
jgi:hypothetical protein